MQKTTALYRHYNSANELLYVGISYNALNRFSQHKTSSKWSAQVARTDTEYFDTREQALSAEKVAIRSENPIFNVVHNNKKPLSNKHALAERRYNLSKIEEDSDNTQDYVHDYPIYVGYDEALDDFYICMGDDIFNAMNSDPVVTRYRIMSAINAASNAFSVATKNMLFCFNPAPNLFPI